MARKPDRIDPEVQLQADMIELMGLPAFHRFLFTIIGRSGICAVAYGTEVATSYYEGRRSLGIDILRMADNALSVTTGDNMPFAAMVVAISEGMRSPNSGARNATQPNVPDNPLDLDDDVDAYERR